MESITKTLTEILDLKKNAETVTCFTFDINRISYSLLFHWLLQVDTKNVLYSD